MTQTPRPSFYPMVVGYVLDGLVTLQVQQMYGGNGAMAGTTQLAQIALDDAALGERILEGLAESERVSASEISDDQVDVGYQALLDAVGATRGPKWAAPFEMVRIVTDPSTGVWRGEVDFKNKSGRPVDGTIEERPLPITADAARDLFWDLHQRAVDARARNGKPA